MPDDPGHHYRFGPPAGGWPSFDADGKRRGNRDGDDGDDGTFPVTSGDDAAA